MKVLIVGMGAIGHSIAATIKASEIDVLVSKEVEIDTISSITLTSLELSKAFCS